MKRQEGHLPEWQGLVVGCRILGVLAVDVCKGFVVTTMCLSCEKAEFSCCSSRAAVKHVVGKARCPKKKYINKNCFKKGSGWKGGKKNKKQTINKRRKHVRKKSIMV